MHADGRLGSGSWILAGDSAGGGLALAVAQVLRDRGGPSPAGLLLTAPWVDLELDRADLDAAAHSDPMLSRSFLRWCAQLYADGVPLTEPRLSPINASLAGLPPVHLNVGTLDLLRQDVVRLRDGLIRAGISVTFIEQDGGVHTYPQLEGAAAEWAVRSQAEWVTDVLSDID
jgi:acetyl esterase/lipase